MKELVCWGGGLRNLRQYNFDLLETDKICERMTSAGWQLLGVDCQINVDEKNLMSAV